MNKCPCEKPGWCEEYRIDLLGRLWEICNDESERSEKYRKLWKETRLPEGSTRVTIPAPISYRPSGPGSLLHSLIRSVTGEEPQAGCGCNAKIAEMNQWQYRTLLNPVSSTGAEQRAKLCEWMVEAANEHNKRHPERPVEVPTSASMWGLLKAAWREWRKKPKEANADAARTA